jgi:hypothetical protein
MQKLITVYNHDSSATDDLNEYLSNGWEVINTVTFPQGTHFLIKETGIPTKVQSVKSIPRGISYKGAIKLDHPLIKEGSMVITTENTAYIITKTS